MKRAGQLKLLWAALLLLLAAFLLRQASIYIEGFADFYSRTVYRALSGSIGRIFGVLPFSVTEFLLYAFLLCFLFAFCSCFVRSFCSKAAAGAGASGGKARFLFRQLFYQLFRLLLSALLFAAALSFLYMAGCGVNYRRTSFSREEGIETVPRSKEELYALCRFLVERVGETEAEASEGAWDGRIGQTEETAKPGFGDLLALGEEGSRAMARLGEKYPGLSGIYPLPKPLLFSRLLSVQQLTGVYSPFALEANYNREIPYYNLPFTICHELSHLRGYMQEQEANFIAFLACAASEDAYFRYAAYLNAFVYCGNALARVDREGYSQLYGQLPERARQDLAYNNRFWVRYESKVSEVAERVNDSYLKANGQSQGVQSYGRVADLILEYYCRGLL